MILGGEEHRFSEKACHSAALSTWTGLEMNPVSHGEGSAANRLSHTTAHGTLFLDGLTIEVPAVGGSVLGQI